MDQYKPKTNQTQTGDWPFSSGRHQMGQVDFLLENTPEKEKQMLASPFSCQLGLFIPNQTPWSCMLSRVLHLPGIIADVGVPVPKQVKALPNAHVHVGFAMALS